MLTSNRRRKKVRQEFMCAKFFYIMNVSSSIAIIAMAIELEKAKFAILLMTVTERRESSGPS